MSGRNIKATGSNPIAAPLAGVKTTRETYPRVYGRWGLECICGNHCLGKPGFCVTKSRRGVLLPAFAAAYLSTVIFSAGRFTVIGTSLGGIFVLWVAQGLIEGGLNFTWTEVVNGGVPIIAVSLSTLLRRRLR